MPHDEDESNQAGSDATPTPESGRPSWELSPEEQANVWAGFEQDQRDIARYMREKGYTDRGTMPDGSGANGSPSDAQATHSLEGGDLEAFVSMLKRDGALGPGTRIRIETPGRNPGDPPVVNEVVLGSKPRP